MQMPQRLFDKERLADAAFDGGVPRSLGMGNGQGYTMSTALITEAEDNFTVELWAKTTSTHEIDGESTSGYGGFSGQKYVIDPVYGGFISAYNVAGMGISVGTNGVSVYEFDNNDMPALLVWESPTALTDWTHIAVVYENKQPRQYINGLLDHTGLTSPMPHVYAGNLVASGYFGTMDGQVDEVRVGETCARVEKGLPLSKS